MSYASSNMHNPRVSIPGLRGHILRRVVCTVPLSFNSIRPVESRGYVILTTFNPSPWTQSGQMRHVKRE